MNSAPRPVLDPRASGPKPASCIAGFLRSPIRRERGGAYLTQSFVYDTAEACEARFKGDEEGFIYSRFSNPNRRHVRSPHVRGRSAEAARATTTGMAAVTASLLCQLKAGDHVVAAKALFGSCRYVVEELLPASASPRR